MTKAKICIIDDNASICHSLEILFNSVYSDTVDVLTYSNPVVFLEVFSPDWTGCLIIDLFMPHWNGIDLMNELKAINSSMRAIIMSGHASINVATQSLESGAYAFLSKPFNVDNLLGKVNDMLRREQ